MARKVRVIDVTKCIGCKSCQVACKNWNQLPAAQTTFTGSYENPVDLMPQSWSRVKFNEHASGGNVKWYFNFFSCMHCSDPACTNICPVNAIHKTSLETVKIDQGTCIGCGLCKTACPFDVPRIGQITGKNASWKCTSCFDRISNGMATACATACPTGTITFGDEAEKLAAAEARVAELKSRGYTGAQLYGKEELGGLGVIYVLADSPDKYGLPVNPEVALSTYIWNVALQPVKFLAAVGITFGLMNSMIGKIAEKKNKKEDPEKIEIQS
ncbi:MAG: 4Fe-4S dicluster domain-containing protein [Bacillota bacterium]